MWILELLTGPYSNVVTACLALVVTLLLLWPKIFEKYRFPPGPIPLPFIGNSYIFFSKSRSVYKYDKWYRKYGDVVSHVIFGRWTVELFGYDAIHEAFVKNAENFSNRSFAPLPGVKDAKPGLIFGDNWNTLRRQALMVFRDHGMGKSAIEDSIRDELECLLEELSTLKSTENSNTFKTMMGKAVSNVINRIVFGHRLDYHDVKLDSLSKFESFFVKAFKSRGLPLYRYWPWDPLGLKEATQHFQRARDFFKSEITLHRQNLDVDNPKDYIDSYLAEGIKTGNPVFANEGELVDTIFQMYLAGYDTSSTTLTWALLFLINYPEAQQKIHEEIQDVVGSRCVTLSDRDSMNFTQSFIHEVLRSPPVIPGGLQHLCTGDTMIRGKLIPKGTVVFANLYSTCHDEEIYPDSYSFKPDRFLDEQGVFVKPTGKQLLPFSIGKRACLGEGLARTELFMFLVSIVQRFEVSRIGEDKLCEDGANIFALSPQSFEFNLKQRS